MERIISESKKKDFIEITLNFISENQWTISNFNEVSFEVVDHMEKNAVLKELTTPEVSAQGKGV